jgi:putative membrane protein
MVLLLKWVIMATSILIAAYLIPGVKVAGFWTALWVALLLGIINVLVKPVLILITLPINILTLGLFTFVINALLILLASSVIQGFQVRGFWVAVLYSIVLSLINHLLAMLFVAK